MIEYRKMCKKDHNTIKRLVTEAWFDEYDFQKCVIKNYAKGYLYSYLAESNFQYVAVEDNKTVGFIFGRVNKVGFWQKLYYNFRLALIGFKLLFFKAGRRGIKIQSVTNKVNKKLLKQSPVELRNELVLFIVDSNHRNKGIGTVLEKLFVDFVKSKGEDKYFLFTDTYSNVGYYESKGYKRASEAEVDFNVDGEKENPLPYYYVYYKEV